MKLAIYKIGYGNACNCKHANLHQAIDNWQQLSGIVSLPESCHTFLSEDGINSVEHSMVLGVVTDLHRLLL